MAAEDIFVGSKGEQRLRNTEFVLPIVVGTIATPLPKGKANEFSTHKWSCYVRSANNEDISHIVKSVTFLLHPSFASPTRILEVAPFEVHETGWGEFEISVTLSFHDDAIMDDLELFHRLKLFPDSDSALAKTKPVVNEQYEEAIFWEPTQAFMARMNAHQPQPAPPSLLAPFFIKFDEEAEVRKLTTARQRVAQLKAQVQTQLEALPARAHH